MQARVAPENDMSNVQLADFCHPTHPGAPLRIDWIGDPRRQVDSDGRPAFEVPVLVSALHRWCDRPNGSWFTDKSLPQSIIWCSADALPVLALNSVWEGGRRRRHPHAAKVQTLQFIKADRHVRVGERLSVRASHRAFFPIPFNLYTVASRENWRVAKDTTLLVGEAIRADGTEVTVFIPSIELARFYACPSSLLARSLFSGEWATLEWQPGSYTALLDSGERVIVIGQKSIKGLDRQAAAYQARYRFFPQMRYWVNAAGNYLQASGLGSHNRAAPTSGDLTSCFRFGFPFCVPEIEPRVDCECIELTYQDQPGLLCVLITRLLRCNAPFAPLRVQANPILNAGQGEEFSHRDKIAITIPRRVPQPGARKLRGVLAESTVPAKRAYAAPETPNKAEVEDFIDDDDQRSDWLVANPVQTAPNNASRQSYDRRYVIEGADRATRTSLNPGRGKRSDAVETKIQPGEQLPSTSKLDTFLSAINLLQGRTKDSGIEIAQISDCTTNLDAVVDQRFYRGQFIISLVLQPIEQSRWLYIIDLKGEPGGITHRHVALAVVRFFDGRSYLVGEIERRRTEKFCIFACELARTDDSLQSLVPALLAEIGRRQQWPLWDAANSTWAIGKSQIEGRRLIHTWSDDVKVCAKRILELLNRQET